MIFEEQTEQEPIISIHALLAESDAQVCQVVSAELYFYPRSPCGERRVGGDLRARRIVFLSTLSLRRATEGYQMKRPA